MGAVSTGRVDRVRARAELEVTGGQRIRWRAEPPVALRRTGQSRVHLVAAAGGPLGGDQLELHIRLAEHTELTVRSAAATVAQPGRPGSGPTRWTVTAELAAEATLRWLPEPTVVCDDAELHAELRVFLVDGAGALLREDVQLGRHGQRGGRYRGALAVDYAGQALIRHTTVFVGADPALCGPGGTAGARMVSTLLGAGTQPEPMCLISGEADGARWARHELVGQGWLWVGVDDRPLRPSCASWVCQPLTDLATG